MNPPEGVTIVSMHDTAGVVAAIADAVGESEPLQMKRYHFSLGDEGGRGSLGIAGALYAYDDDEAVGMLQAALDKGSIEGPDNRSTSSAEEQNADGELDYIDCCINGEIVVTIDDFDEIVPVDEDGNEIEDAPDPDCPF